MKNNSLTIAGLMSGTSMDGLDCCIAKVAINKNWDFNYEIIATKSFDFNFNVRAKICENLGETQISNIALLDDFMGETFLNLSKDFLSSYKFDAISIHGQTIHHRDKVKTIQVGNPFYLGSFFKVPVVYNFREKDIDAGGNGAPLMPFLDWLLFKNSKENVFTINLGGISNLTFIPKGGIRKNVIGFDMGPGMCLSDQYMRNFFNKKYDDYGRLASKGKVIEKLLDKLMNNEFFYKKPPKSTSVENFSENYMSEILNEFNEINKFDFLRTLVNFTCRCIEQNISLYTNLNSNKDKIFLSGGGSKNITLVNDLKEMISPRIENFNYNGINVDNKEAFLMCLLGYTCVMKIPNNISSVTGASRELVCGEIYE